MWVAESSFAELDGEAVGVVLTTLAVSGPHRMTEALRGRA